MQTGKHKDKFFAACFVKKPNPKIDDKGKPAMKDGKPVMEMVSRKADVAYWSDKSVKDAEAGLQSRMKRDGFQIDAERTKTQKCKVVDSVEWHKKMSVEKEKESVKKENTKKEGGD